jgi:hypothetical protein
VPKTGLGGYEWVIPDLGAKNTPDHRVWRQEGRNRSEWPTSAITAAPARANPVAAPRRPVRSTFRGYMPQKVERVPG